LKEQNTGAGKTWKILFEKHHASFGSIFFKIKPFTQNQISKPLQMKKTKIACLPTCFYLPLTTCLPLFVCSLKT
jgi:hypothetical protein